MLDIFQFALFLFKSVKVHAAGMASLWKKMKL